MAKLRSILLSVCIVAAFAVTATLFFWPYLPQSVKDAVSTDDGTAATRPTMDSHYLYTAPSEWFSVGDEVNWNDELVFCVESARVSPTLPDDVDDMTEVYIHGFAHYQQLAWEQQSLFLDMTIAVTCTALPSNHIDGQDVTELYQPITITGQMIGCYDLSRDEISSNRTQDVAVQDLSGNAESFGLRDCYYLKVGETARYRRLVMISRDAWEEKAVLLTPRWMYDAATLNLRGFSQPHIHLNEQV